MESSTISKTFLIFLNEEWKEGKELRYDRENSDQRKQQGAAKVCQPAFHYAAPGELAGDCSCLRGPRRDQQKNTMQSLAPVQIADPQNHKQIKWWLFNAIKFWGCPLLPSKWQLKKAFITTWYVLSFYTPWKHRLWSFCQFVSPSSRRESISISVFNKYAICVSEQKTICSFGF